jgi:hypothetical protein
MKQIFEEEGKPFTVQKPVVERGGRINATPLPSPLHHPISKLIRGYFI